MNVLVADDYELIVDGLRVVLREIDPEVAVLRAADAAGALETARQALHRFAQDHIPENVAVQHILCHGTVYEEIIKEATAIGADLVIMTAHRPELRDYLLGPNAARVVRHAPMSVLVIRD